MALFEGLFLEGLIYGGKKTLTYIRHSDFKMFRRNFYEKVGGRGGGGMRGDLKAFTSLNRAKGEFVSSMQV